MMSSVARNGVSGGVAKKDGSPVTKKKCLPGMVALKSKQASSAPLIVERSVLQGKVVMEKDVESQIFNNFKPPHKPTVPDPALGLLITDASLFTCVDCGDRFYLESSLTQHLARRSVKFSLWRTGLTKQLVFYNRCNLLADLRKNMKSGVKAHIRAQSLERDELLGHSNGEQSSAADVLQTNTNNIIAPPVDSFVSESPFISLQKLTSSILPSESSSKSDVSVVTQAQNKSFRKLLPKPVAATPVKCELKMVKHKSSFEPLIVETCPECNIQLASNVTLKQHFAGSVKKSGPRSNCSKCKLPFPTICSLKCHEKIHSLQCKNRSSFICPECGVEFLDWDIFMEHLHNDCMHAYENVCYQCKKCLAFFLTGISLEVHILKVHVKKIHKCAICTIACFSIEALQKHRRELHNGEVRKPIMCQLCELCPGKLITQSQLLFHVHQHAEDPEFQLVRYVCEPCGVFVESKQEFKQHKEICTITESNFTKSETSPGQEQNQLVTKKVLVRVPSPDTSTSSPMTTPKREKEDKNDTQLFQVINHPCHKCGVSMLPYKKSFACFKCNKNLNKSSKKSPNKKIMNGNNNIISSDDSNSMNSNIDSKINSTASLTIDCPICKKSINDDYISVQYHFLNEHSDVEIGRRTYRHDLNELRKKLEANQNKMLKKIEYKCHICDLLTDDEEEFREHIITHQPEDGPAFQCLECGKCYVVKPSLEKHLLLLHKIKGVDDYLRETGQENAGDRALGNIPLKDDQCEVCYAEFESSQDLNSHMRKHGMAYLKNIS